MESATGSQQFNFAIEVPLRQPRPWERVPKSPLASHRRGRKLWKRYEPRSGKALQAPHVENDSASKEPSHSQEELISTSSKRPIKRLRNAPHLGEEGAPIETQYTTTLRDKAPGTPKRKYTKRKSLKADLVRKAVNKQTPRKNATHNAAASIFVPDEASVNPQHTTPSYLPDVAVVIPLQEGGRNEVEEDTLRARRSPSLENVKQALGNLARVSAQTDDADSGVEEENASRVNTDVPEVGLFTDLNEEDGAKVNSGEPAELSGPETHETGLEPPGDDEEPTISSPEEVHNAGQHSPTGTASFNPDLDHNAEAASEATLRVESLETTATPSPCPSTLRIHQSTTVNPVLHEATAPTEESPTQTSLNLEQELSSTDGAIAESAISKVEYDKGSMLDNEAHTSAEQHDVLEDPKDRDQSRWSHGDNKIPKVEIYGQTTSHVQSTQESEVDLPASCIDLIANERQDAYNVIIDGEESPDVSMSSPEALSQTDPGAQYELASQPGNENNANQLEDSSGASQLTQDRVAIAAMPVKTTRSGARFSDDTNLLKDFLNRAKAKKMIQDIQMPANEAPPTSPRRSPRKALAERTNNSPSPQKPQNLANRPGTPQGKQRLDAFAFEDVDELTAEPTSIRRSARTRLPAATKTPPGAPSFIPVRRADGADPIILQKSQAQELAVQTRANTRRNKGQSKPPNVALQTALQNLTAETVETISTRVHMNENSKSVGWDERLVYYQESLDAAQEAAKEEGKEEKRPKVRRLRGLGAATGTPAPKRMADVAIPNGTPAPRRRGKLR